MEYTKAGAYRNPTLDAIDFYITRRVPHDDSHQIGYVTMKPVFDMAAAQQPGFRLTAPNAQKLMNDLWGLGIRPDEMSETEGALKATQDHLSDMQQLFFRSFDYFISLNVQDRIIDE